MMQSLIDHTIHLCLIGATADGLSMIAVWRLARRHPGAARSLARWLDKRLPKPEPRRA